MAPNTRSSAQTPAGRIYHSSPALRQAQFPSRRRVVKTYGKSTLASARARTLRQQTLTQIYDINQHLVDADALLLPPESPSAEQEAVEEKENPRRGRGRSSKRRKTMGDTPSSSFHTQTLTQLPFLSSDERELEELILRDAESGEGADSDPEKLPRLRAESEPEPEPPKKGRKARERPRSDSKLEKDLFIAVESEEDAGSDREELPRLDAESKPPKKGRRARGRPRNKSAGKKVALDQQEDDTMPVEDPHSGVAKKGRGKATATVKGKGKPAPVKPNTPSGPKFRTEVPSSQPSPFTPMLDRYGPIDETRSPLAQLSTNKDAPTPTVETMSQLKLAASLSSKPPRPRDMVIQDSYSTVPSSSVNSNIENVTPVPAPAPLAKRSTGSGKRKREPLADIPLQDVMARDAEVPVDAEAGRVLKTMTSDDGDDNSGVETPTKPRREIPDSDADEDDFDLSPEKVEQTPMKNHAVEEKAEKTPNQTHRASDLTAEGGLENTGDVCSPEESGEKSTTKTTAAPHSARPSTERIIETPTKGPQASGTLEQGLNGEVELEKLTEAPKEVVGDDDAEVEASLPGTPTPKIRKVHIELPSASLGSQQRKSATKRRSPAVHKKSSTLFLRQTQSRSQFYSQGLESQRVPLDVIKAMGPQHERSDVVIPMDEKTVEEIHTGRRDHEFRAKPLPPDTQRIWIYAMAPVSELRYMATVGPAKQPGEIDDFGGFGNAEFNNGTSGHKIAHELLQVYELNNPLSWDRIKQEGWLKTPPKPNQRMIWLKPVILSRLLNNLRSALFAGPGVYIDHDNDHDHALDPTQYEAGRSEPTDSQQLANQLSSDILDETQRLMSKDNEDVIPASQGSIDRKLSRSSASKSTNSDDVFARPTAPARPTRSSQRLQRHAQSQALTQNMTQSQSQSLPKLFDMSSAASRWAPGNGANLVRSSQATTASGPSSQAAAEAATQDMATLPSSVEKPPQTPRLLPDSSVASLPDFAGAREEGEQSSGRRRAQQHSSLLVSSQAVAALPESLFAENVRLPPPDVIWDSEDDEPL